MHGSDFSEATGISELSSFVKGPLGLFSAKAGLRAGEIANLTWDMLVDANGHISGLIELRDQAAKKCSGRSIPIHPDVAAALAAWRQVAPSSDYVIASERGGAMTALSIVVWFNRAFKNIGLKGCSSHSGRRTFVTREVNNQLGALVGEGACDAFSQPAPGGVWSRADGT